MLYVTLSVSLIQIYVSSITMPSSRKGMSWTSILQQSMKLYSYLVSTRLLPGRIGNKCLVGIYWPRSVANCICTPPPTNSSGVLFVLFRQFLLFLQRPVEPGRGLQLSTSLNITTEMLAKKPIP